VGRLINKEMRKIHDEIMNLSISPLYKYRCENSYLPVIGDGALDADIIFVGEAPGKNEAKTGKPFCGAAGKILDNLLDSIDLKREHVYITNIVKDRPQENRDPSAEEIKIYGPFLDREIELIKPKIIVTLGRYAMEYIMKKYDPGASLKRISTAHGKPYSAQANFGPITIISQYHPAAAIYNRELMPLLEKDFVILKEVLHSLS